jgi:hypothetical protein
MAGKGTSSISNLCQIWLKSEQFACDFNLKGRLRQGKQAIRKVHFGFQLN